MKEVVCWCCEYFVSLDELKNLDGEFMNGKCEYNDLLCFSENKVCENFILKSGLYTLRTIPDICKNYSNALYAENNK